ITIRLFKMKETHSIILLLCFFVRKDRMLDMLQNGSFTNSGISCDNDKLTKAKTKSEIIETLKRIRNCKGLLAVDDLLPESVFRAKEETVWLKDRSLPP